MHSALYLSSTLLFLPLLVPALSLPSCQDLDIPCESLKPASKWVLKEGPPLLEAESAEKRGNTDAPPVLKPRKNVLERSVDEPEGSTRRAIDWALSKAGTEAPAVLSNAVRALTKRWGIFPGIIEEDAVGPQEEPIDNAAVAAAAAADG